MKRQNERLRGSPHDVAGELMTQLDEAVEKARNRFNNTASDHADNVIVLETALSTLRTVEETAAWATRMLIEVTGRHRKENRNPSNTPSMRKMAQISGVSLASVHAWVNHPARVHPDGATGPGTLPKPGQTSHFHNRGPGIFREDDGSGDLA